MKGTIKLWVIKIKNVVVHLEFCIQVPGYKSCHQGTCALLILSPLQNCINLKIDAKKLRAQNPN